MILGSLILDLFDEGVHLRDEGLLASSGTKLKVSWLSAAGLEGEEEVVVVVRGYGTTQSSLGVA